MVPNSHGVSVRQWKKWKPCQHRMFNEMYELLSINQHVYKHPKAELIPDDDWNVVSWNMAFEAAHMCVQ